MGTSISLCTLHLTSCPYPSSTIQSFSNQDISAEDSDQVSSTIDFQQPDVEPDDCDPFEREGRSQQLLHHCSVLSAGGIAGSIGKTITAPLSRLTILFQVHSSITSQRNDSYSSTLHGAIRKVIRNEGILALWKGNGASVLHRFPYSAVNFFTYEILKHSMDQPKGTSGAWKNTFLSGAVAGAFATIACYPIDLIRTRLATQKNQEKRYNGIAHAGLKIRSEEGFLGLYRGLCSTLFVTVPNLAINFTLYESLKEKTLQWRYEQRLEEVDEDEEDLLLGFRDTLLCGGVSGIASSLVTFPVDVVRRRLQVAAVYSQDPKLASGFLAVASQLFREQGIKGFYRGLCPEILKVIPMVGITFGSFDKLKSLMEID